MIDTLRWSPRAEPLAPVAAVGWGQATAAALGRRLLAFDDDALGRWQGVAGPEVLLVLDPTPADPIEPPAPDAQAPPLPWVEGVQYLGWDPGAPGLLLPTTLSPEIPGELLAMALSRRVPPGQAPLALLTQPPRIVPAGSARPIDRAALTRWLDALP